ncbi:hypothetical protein ACFE04_020894 [Oxalis oulophora]
MPSLVSLLSSGSGRVGIVGTSCSETPAYSIACRRVSVSYRYTRRWCRLSSSVVVRRYAVTTTHFVTEQDNAVVSFDSNLSDSDKAALSPVLGESDFGGVESSSRDGFHSEDKNKVIDSFGEVLGKAEKRDTLRPSRGTYRRERVRANVNVVPSRVNIDSRNASKPADSVLTRKTKTMKSVWRKGDSIAAVEKVVVKQAPKISRVIKEPKTEIEEKPAQPPFKPQPNLQQRPSVGPPPVLKKPVILKDVGAIQKPQVLDDTDSNVKPKERKTILIDKFASKQRPISLDIARSVIPPPKPGQGQGQGQGPESGKHRKKYGSRNAGGRKRKVGNDNDESEIDEEEDEEDEENETVELKMDLKDLAIKGATVKKKGKKWNKAKRKAARRKAAEESAPVRVEILEVGEKGMSVEELAYNLAITEGEVLGFMYSKGIKPEGVQTLNKDLVKMVCKKYEVEVLDADPVKVEEMARKTEIFDEEDLDNLEDRPPVLTIMGHVDHGKTTLLDHIRRSKVAASEAGGITQGIGAYKVLVPVDGKLQPCVFLDTPGHEAFGAMRARGAKVTDIAVIVVAADDGIRPQTNEAIAHAKAAGVPIVIAINKIDKDGANPDRVMQELSSIGLVPEDWGGDIPMVQISALRGTNVDDLLEIIMLVAELEELKANPNRNAKGTVIEAGLQKSRGPVATFIVQNGTLKKGDIVVSGEAYGKVRSLVDNGGQQVDNAGPSIPVQVIGLNNVPFAGDKFEVVGSIDVAREKAEARAESLKIERLAAKAGDRTVTLSNLASAVSSGKVSGIDIHHLNIVLKVDVQVSAGLECGIALENFDAFEEGDILESFNSIEKRRTLEEASASMAAAVKEVET